MRLHASSCRHRHETGWKDQERGFSALTVYERIVACVEKCPLGENNLGCAHRQGIIWSTILGKKVAKIPDEAQKKAIKERLDTANYIKSYIDQSYRLSYGGNLDELEIQIESETNIYNLIVHIPGLNIFWKDIVHNIERKRWAQKYDQAFYDFLVILEDLMIKEYQLILHEISKYVNIN